MSTAKTQGLFNGITVEFTAGTEATRGFVAVMLYNAIFLDSVKYNTTLNINEQQVGTSIMERVFGYETFTGNVVATNNLGTDGNNARQGATNNVYVVKSASGTEKFYAETATQMDAYFGTTVKVFYKSDLSDDNPVDSYVSNGVHTESICIPQQGTIESSIVNNITTDAAGNYVINGAAFAPANVLVATVNGGVGTYVQAAPTGTAAYRVFVANGVAYVTPGAVGRYYADVQTGSTKYEFGVADINAADDALKTNAASRTGLDLEENVVLNLNKVVSTNYVEYFYDGAVLDAYKLTKTTAKYNAFSENTYKFGDNWYQESAYDGSVALANDPTGDNTNLYVDSFGKIAYAVGLEDETPADVYDRPTNMAILTEVKAGSFYFDTTNGEVKQAYTFKGYTIAGVEISGIVDDWFLYGCGSGGVVPGHSLTWEPLKKMPFVFTVDETTGNYTFGAIFYANNLGHSDPSGSAAYNEPTAQYAHHLIPQKDVNGDYQNILPMTGDEAKAFFAAEWRPYDVDGKYGFTTYPGAKVINAGSYMLYKHNGMATSVIYNPLVNAQYVVLTAAAATMDSPVTAINFYTKADLPSGEYALLTHLCDNVVTKRPDVIFLIKVDDGTTPPATAFKGVVLNRVVTPNTDTTLPNAFNVDYSICKLDGTTVTVSVNVNNPTADSAFALGSLVNVDGTTMTASYAPNTALYYGGDFDGFYYFLNNDLYSWAPNVGNSGIDAYYQAPVQKLVDEDTKIYVISSTGAREGTAADIRYCKMIANPDGSLDMTVNNKDAWPANGTPAVPTGSFSARPDVYLYNAYIVEGVNDYNYPVITELYLFTDYCG